MLDRKTTGKRWIFGGRGLRWKRIHRGAPITSRIPARPPTRSAQPSNEAGPYKGYGKKIQEAFAAIVPPDEDAGSVADAIVKILDAPFGKRPFRVHIDPTQDGADVAFAVMDRVRSEMLHRVGLSELPTPAGAESRTASNA
jgi:hypothetical protein